MKNSDKGAIVMNGKIFRNMNRPTTRNRCTICRKKCSKKTYVIVMNKKVCKDCKEVFIKPTSKEK